MRLASASLIEGKKQAVIPLLVTGTENIFHVAV